MNIVRLRPLRYPHSHKWVGRRKLQAIARMLKVFYEPRRMS